jgi:ketosteroid isomerase-like protein
MKSICLALSAGVLLPLLAGGAAQSSDSPTRPHAAEDGREAINDVLNRYVAAMQARDLAALKVLWPGMEESQATKIQEAFRFTRILRIELEVSDIQVEGRKAVVSCKRKDQVVTVEGQSFKSTRQATIMLEKSGGWLISAITIK